VSLHHWAAKSAVYTHRWLGIVLGVLFVVWFASGIVMMYARMPELSTVERLSKLPPLNPSSIRAAAPGIDRVNRVTMAMLGDRPVYRLLQGRQWKLFYADTGDPLEPIDQSRALAIAGAFAPDRAQSLTYEEHLTDADQWTFGVRGLMPMHRIALGDALGTKVYVSDQTAEVVQVTTASGRVWGWLGAVLHWVYFTSFRRNAALWNEFIVWSSLVGTFMSIIGLGWGIWRLSPSMGYRLKRVPSRSPYAGWMKWHHIAGLIFGVTSITWVFSGLLSMDPWDWHPSTAPSMKQREIAAGGAITVTDRAPQRLVRAIQEFGDPPPKEIEVLQFRGTTYLRADVGLVSFDAPEKGVRSEFDRADIEKVAHAVMGTTAIEDQVWLDHYDAYYYDRDGQLSLPVLRVRYLDPQRTWLYLDPKRGAIVRKEERLTRLNRWLYHGLHSLDFPFLYYRRPLWDIVVIVLSIGGIVLSASTILASWRRLKRHAKAIVSRAS
jgi:hypothetical protein